MKKRIKNKKENKKFLILTLTSVLYSYTEYNSWYIESNKSLIEKMIKDLNKDWDVTIVSHKKLIKILKILVQVHLNVNVLENGDCIYKLNNNFEYKNMKKLIKGVL